MAKNVIITPANGFIEFLDTSVRQGSVYELNGNIYISPNTGNVVLGSGAPSNIEVGNSTTSVNFSFLGGGNISGGGNPLGIGLSGDTVNLNVAGVTYNFPSTLVTTSTYTASDVLTKIKTVDGSGSGLDADLLDGQQGSYYTNATNITTGTLPYAQIPGNVVNTTSNFSIAGAWTFNANVTFGAADHLILSSTSGISVNGSYGTSGQMLTSNGTAVYWSTPQIGDITAVTAGNGLTGGGTSGDVTLTVGAGNGVTVNSTAVAVNANTGIVANATGVYVNSAYIATLSSNTATYINATPASLTGNIDTQWTTGMYGYSPTTTGTKPTAGFGTVFNLLNSGTTHDNSSNWLVQLAFDTNNTSGYFRSKINAGAFGAWNTLLHNNNYNAYAPTLTGANASGTWGISITGTANNATYFDTATWAAPKAIGTGTANTGAFTTVSAGNTTITGFANITSNSAVLRVGNATNFSTANTSGFYPVSNTLANALGSTTQRWALNATTGSFAGAVSGITTLAAGNTTITGFANVISDSAVLRVGNATSFSTANTSGLYPVSNTLANALGAATQRWALNATTGSFAGAVSGITTLATGNTTITGFANITSNSAVLRVGNATNFSTANTTGFYPVSNTLANALGSATQRWALNATTGSFAGAVSGITTLAAGNTTVTGFANVTGSIQGGSTLTIAGAASGITTLAAGNTTITGFANVTSTIRGGAGLTIAGAASGITTLAAGNTTITGFANVSTTLQVGGLATFNGNVQLNAADHLILSSTSGVSANGTFGTNGQVLTTNGTSAYWANTGASGAAANGVIWENNVDINTTYTLSANKNGLSVGPINIASGNSVTIPSGARWVIL